MEDPYPGLRLPTCWGISTIHQDANEDEEYVADR